MIYFTPGPSQLHPIVPAALREAIENDIGSISHRGERFSRIYDRAADGVRAVMGCPGHKVFFLSSATECMERILQNLVIEKSIHFTNGAFSERFAAIADQLGLSPTRFDAPFGKGFEYPDGLPEAELLCATHCETSAGTMVDLERLSALKREGMLFALDVVSTAPYADIDWGVVDCAFFSVQKGFGLPAGLSVLIVNDACIARANRLAGKKCTGSYHSFESLLAKDAVSQTVATPNVLDLHLLGLVCEDYLEEGIDALRERIDAKAELIYDEIGRHPRLEPFADESVRSPTAATILVDDPAALRVYCERQGFVIGTGYGKRKREQVRIGNFPATSLEETGRLVGVLREF